MDLVSISSIKVQLGILSPGSVVGTHQANNYGNFQQRIPSGFLAITDASGSWRANVFLNTLAANRSVTINSITADGFFVITGNDNDFGAGTNQIFRDGTIRFQPPAGGPYYTLTYGTAPAANRVITIPVLTAAANLVFDSFANTFTVSQILNNNIAIFGKTVGGASRRLCSVSTTDVMEYGDNSGNGNAMQLYGGVSTYAVQINSTNFVTFQKLAQAGTAELLAKWTVSDDTGSTFNISNGTNVDGSFVPWITTLTSSNVSSGQPSLYIYNYIQAAADTGTQAVLVVDGRRAGDVALTTRPVVDFRNAGTSIFKLGPTGDQTITSIARAGVAEVPLTISVSDDASTTVSIRNGFTTDNLFAPIFLWQASANVDSGKAACYFYTYINVASDTSSTVPACVFNAGNSNATAIVNRPTHEFRNNGVGFFKFNPKGDADHTVIATNSSAEIIYDWLVSDVANSYLRLQNYSSTDAVFVPNFRAVNSQAANSFPGFVFHAYIATAQDSGTEAAMLFDSRKIDESALSVRPAFKFRTSGTDLFSIYPTLFDFKGLPLKSHRGVETTEFTKTGSVHCGAPVASNVLYGNGLLAYQTATGTVATDIDSVGGYNRVTAAASTDALAEIHPPNKIATRNKNTLWRIKMVFDSLTDVRAKFGFNTASSPTVGNTTITTGNNGAMFRFNSALGDTNLQFCVADGTNPEVVTDTGFTPVIATLYQLEINFNNTNIIWTIYNGTTGAQLATGTVSSGLPPSTTSSYLHKRTENVTSTAKSWYFREEAIYRDF